MHIDKDSIGAFDILPELVIPGESTAKLVLKQPTF